MGKVLNLKEFLKEREALKEKGLKLVTTNGCFDILHIGHVKYLQESKAQGDKLAVLLNSDASTRRLKGPTRPVNNENDRAGVMAALETVDYVLIFEDDTPSDFISQIKPDVHTKGGDYDINTLPEAKIIQESGGQVVFINFIEGKSTTKIIEKIQT